MAEIGSIIDGRYRLIQFINKGGTSVVYLAENIRLGNRWAVKEIRKTGGQNNALFIRSLIAEAEMLSDLDYPAFPRIVDIIEESDALYLVMDYIEGPTLQDILRQEGPQPEEVVRDWALQLCDALTYLHTQDPPIIYRDMKPSNVILKNDGSLKIIDFGTARVYNPAKAADTVALGTGGFAPPEQYHGRTDARSDIYALGVTMHYLMTGITPWNRDSAPGHIVLSQGMAAIIAGCTSLYPEERYSSCRELAYALERLDEPVELPASASEPTRLLTQYEPPVFTPDKAPRPRRLLPVVLILTLILLAVGTGLVFVWQNTIKDSGSSQRPVVPYSSMADYADLLSAEQEADLAQRLDRSYLEKRFVTAIVTTNSLGGKSAQDYADDYYDNHYSGFSTNSDGVMLLVSTEKNTLYITTTGSAIRLFTNDYLDAIFDQLEPYVVSGDYYSAFNTFASMAELPGS